MISNEVPMMNKRDDWPIQCQRFGLGLAWMPVPGKQLDLDVQAVAFDTQGKIMDAVYYNNMKALGKGMTHSGDETTGHKEGFDEVVWINFAKLPENVGLIVFVVACYSGGHLRDAQNGKFVIMEDTASNDKGQFRLEQSGEEVDLVAALVKTAGTWSFRLIEEPAQDGQHFIDILEPTIGNFVRKVIPGAPRRVKAAFAMDKGTVVDLPKSSVIKNVRAALGWDTAKGSVDLDVSAVLMDRHNRNVGAVFFGNLQARGVKHSGDNLTGAGSGDDEVITINLEEVASDVEQIVFVINIYTRGKSFSQVANPYCRIVTDSGDEFCRYQLAEAGREQGLIMARLFREPGAERWGFQAIGAPCSGGTWKDSMSAVMKYAGASAKALQLSRTGSALGGPTIEDSSAAPAVVQTGCNTGDCCVQ
eukprot:TRINITY_DN9352_c0_g1_i1.p1 TRINITY_DN9352_c0_g1~~TRINITY_DN9352_c0_g1_i1.p1  ORF type:complete len:418 (-),score=79.72 TRINITY_DN9352_c0_g1_i1:50-1303(-)